MRKVASLCGSFIPCFVAAGVDVQVYQLCKSDDRDCIDLVPIKITVDGSVEQSRWEGTEISM